jgi:hypothetical protein
MSYIRSVALLKLAEYLLITVVAVALIWWFPARYYEAARGPADYLIGAMIFATEFYAFTLYPVVSSALVLWLVRRGVQSRGRLAGVSALFFVAFSGAVAIGLSANTGKLPPQDFWIALLCTSVGTLALAWWLLPPSQSAVE